MVETAEPQAAEPRARSYAQMVVFVPGIAALGLALLYATGALIKTAQIREHDIRVQDALPLVPIEQLLAIGIGTLMTALWIIVGWAIVVSIFSYFAHRRKIRGTTREPLQLVIASQRVRWAVKGTAWVLLAAIAISLLFTNSLFGAVATLAPAWVMGDVVRAQDRGDVRRVIFLMSAAYLAVVAVRIAETWFSPAPLPRAVIETSDGTTRASLIVARGDAWYVTSESGSTEMIRADGIVTARVESVPREENPLLTWPFDWP